MYKFIYLDLTLSVSIVSIQNNKNCQDDDIRKNIFIFCI